MKKLVIAFLSLVTLSVSVPASADDYGCQVALCLANPGGWDKIMECRPPMKKLFKQLHQGKSFPSCLRSSGGGGGQASEAPRNAVETKQGFEPWHDCPQGTDFIAIENNRASPYRNKKVCANPGTRVDKQTFFGVTPSRFERYDNEYRYWSFRDDEVSRGKVYIDKKDNRFGFTGIVTADRRSEPNWIDTYVDGKFQTRTWW